MYNSWKQNQKGNLDSVHYMIYRSFLVEKQSMVLEKLFAEFERSTAFFGLYFGSENKDIAESCFESCFDK